MKFRKFLTVLLCFVFVLCFVGCGGTEQPSDKPVVPDKNDQNDNTDDNKEEEVMKEKPLLLFQVDPGLGGRGLTTSLNPEDSFYYQAIQNIADGLSPLKEKFELAVLINPQHSYIKSEKGDAKRIKPGLKYALEKFGEFGIKVVLEIYSSDCGTNQNGELASLPKPNLHYGDGQEIAGITMDLSTLSYLKLMFPETLLGVRMHELVGTNQIGLSGNPHGFVVTEGTIKAIVDACDESGMNLFWSDHSWDGINDPNYYPNAWFTGCIDYAVDTLKDRVTFIWANNNWDVCDYIGREEATFPYKNYRGTKFGLSNQSWIWESYASSNTSVEKLGTKWYAHSEMDTPIEVLAAYTLDFLRQGASVIQYEPDYYFFNTHNTPWMNRVGISDLKSEGHPMFYEDKPDFSARINLKLLEEYLLSDTLSENVTDHIIDFIDGDRDIYYSNKASHPYKKYVQTSITAFTDGGINSFDRYIYTPDTFVKDHFDRYTQKVTSGEILFATRINALAKTNDDFLLVKRVDGKNIGYFYNSYSGLIGTDDRTFVDNEKGKVVAVTAGNLIQKTVANVSGDPDEVIVAREKDGRINFTVYNAINTERANYYEYYLEESAQSDAIVQACLGVTEVDANGFAGIVSLGTRRSVLLKNGTRESDGLVVLKQNGNSVEIKGGRNHSVQTYTLECGTVTAAASADITLSVEQQKQGLQDELALAVEKDGKNQIIFVSFADNQATLCNDTVALESKCNHLMALRLGLFYMDN